MRWMKSLACSPKRSGPIKLVFRLADGRGDTIRRDALHVDIGLFHGRLGNLGAIVLIVNGEIPIEVEALGIAAQEIDRQKLWNVLLRKKRCGRHLHTPRVPRFAARQGFQMRCRISPAALFVNVTARDILRPNR